MAAPDARRARHLFFSTFTDGPPTLMAFDRGMHNAHITMSKSTFVIFVSCLPRLERLVEDEVVAIIGKKKIARKHGGVELRVDHAQLWALSHDLRVAGAIRLRLGTAHAPHFDALREGVVRLPWSAYLRRDALPDIQVRCQRSTLYHADAVAERMRTFFIERSGISGADARAYASGRMRASPDAGTVFVRIVNDVATISLDASGAGLYRRGLRTHIHRAPLRETYAAACLRVSGLDRSMRLADPVCGSGVFLVERAAIDGGFALPRSFAFEQWSTHSGEDYRAWCAARSSSVAPRGLRLWGGDRSDKAISAARSNMARWAMGDSLRLQHVSATAFLKQLPDDVDVVANPPWGKQLDGARAVGDSFGRWLRARSGSASGRVFVLVTGHAFLRASGVRWEEVLRFKDGNTPVRWMQYAPPVR